MIDHGALLDRLELHLYPSHGIGWCRTFKTPLTDDAGAVVGLIGFSQDLGAPAEQGAPAGVARAVAYLEANLDQCLRVCGLAAVANMAPRTFERSVQRIFGMSAGEFVVKARIDAACRLLLEARRPIAHVAAECGYTDHSAFTRQFRARVGVTPRAFRARYAPRP